MYVHIGIDSDQRKRVQENQFFCVYVSRVVEGGGEGLCHTCCWRDLNLKRPIGAWRLHCCSPLPTICSLNKSGHTFECVRLLAALLICPFWYSTLHLECHFFILESQSMILFCWKETKEIGFRNWDSMTLPSAIGCTWNSNHVTHLNESCQHIWMIRVAGYLVVFHFQLHEIWMSHAAHLNASVCRQHRRSPLSTMGCLRLVGSLKL